MLNEDETIDETSVVALSDMIEQLLTEKPSKKTIKDRKLYTEWVNQVNSLIDKCNKLTKVEIYSRIK